MRRGRHARRELIRNPESEATRVLARLGVSAEAVEAALAGWLPNRAGPAKIDPQALAYALDHASGTPLSDEHVLLGMVTVPDSVAACVLGELGVTLETMQAVLDEVS